MPLRVLIQVALLFIVVSLVAAGCGDDDSEGGGRSNTTFRLADGSVIQFSDKNNPGLLVTEPLSGGYDLAPTTRLPNSFFDFAIVRINFNSPTLSLVGNAGSLRASKINDGVIIRAEVQINGEMVNFIGSGNMSTYELSSRRLTGLEATGGGYTIKLFAEPQE